jgi:7,8-dihydropterin-6-yl-methyl-4-(beta-D-ribofuranosyl)aminobenzene 5'-phosphate synthase
MATQMSHTRGSAEDRRYSLYYALSGIVRPLTTAAYLRDRREADREWEASRTEKLEGLKAVKHLSILPLMEYYSANDRAATEAGVSYLVTADGTRILFDVGWNARKEHPSPLLRNMELFGISPEQLDGVFISHNHLDHVGGIEQSRARTFSISAGAEQPVDRIDLTGVRAFVPTPMTHPTATVELVTGPRKLADGLASTGPLTSAIWLMGPISEQSLLVNVEGKGLVMIVGCGHPQLPRLIERAQAVTGVPLYGAVGGLHFPVTGSRVGRGRQNIIGNGKLPWQRITRDEAQQAASRLADLDVSLVALSAHDSCDWSLDLFAKALGDRCRTAKAGEEILVA